MNESSFSLIKSNTIMDGRPFWTLIAINNDFDKPISLTFVWLQFLSQIEEAIIVPVIFLVAIIPLKHIHYSPANITVHLYHQLVSRL